MSHNRSTFEICYNMNHGGDKLTPDQMESLNKLTRAEGYLKSHLERLKNDEPESLGIPTLEYLVSCLDGVKKAARESSPEQLPTEITKALGLARNRQRKTFFDQLNNDRSDLIFCHKAVILAITQGAPTSNSESLYKFVLARKDRLNFPLFREVTNTPSKIREPRIWDTIKPALEESKRMIQAEIELQSDDNSMSDREKESQAKDKIKNIFQRELERLERTSKVGCKS